MRGNKFLFFAVPMLSVLFAACSGDGSVYDDSVAGKGSSDSDIVTGGNVGDNPGGGGEGRTTWLLDALIKGRAKSVLYGSFFDPSLAKAAHQTGVGGEFDAQFNSDFVSEFSKPLNVAAEVIALSDGKFVGRLGIYQNRAVDLGLSAALRIGGKDGVVVVVISARHQTADPMFFEMLGLNIGAARTVCVKSRGHFRAGFAPWFPPENVFEVDTAGLTSPVLQRFDWKNLPRPIYPLDEEAVWTVQQLD